MGVANCDHRDTEVKQRPGELKEVGNNLGGHRGVRVDYRVVGSWLAQSFNIAKRTVIIIGDCLHKMQSHSSFLSRSLIRLPRFIEGSADS